MSAMRKETDSLGAVEAPAEKLCGAQTQHSLEYFSIAFDLLPTEMLAAYATLKEVAAIPEIHLLACGPRAGRLQP